MTDLGAFFSINGPLLAPQPHARSPWSAEMMHGRLLAGLAARSVEQEHLDADLHPVRLTIDLFRSPPMAPVESTTSVLRSGRRIKVTEVVQRIGDIEMARTVVVAMRTGEHPDGAVWTPEPWGVPLPDEIPAAPDSPMRRLTSMEIRPIDGMGMGTNGQRKVWLRDTTPLVDGEEISPFQRAAMASDFASPLANSSSEGLRFINGDITLSLGRMPEGEWIGIEVGAHVGHAGVSVARCDLYDPDGRFGFVDVSAVANAPISAPPTNSE